MDDYEMASIKRCMISNQGVRVRERAACAGLMTSFPVVFKILFRRRA